MVIGEIAGAIGTVRSIGSQRRARRSAKRRWEQALRISGDIRDQGNALHARGRNRMLEALDLLEGRGLDAIQGSAGEASRAIDDQAQRGIDAALVRGGNRGSLGSSFGVQAQRAAAQDAMDAHARVGAGTGQALASLYGDVAAQHNRIGFSFADQARFNQSAGMGVVNTLGSYQEPGGSSAAAWGAAAASIGGLLDDLFVDSYGGEGLESDTMAPDYMPDTPMQPVADELVV